MKTFILTLFFILPFTLNTQVVEKVADINPNGWSSPENFIEYNNLLFFSTETEKEGFEIRYSDGTSQGTKLLMDFPLGNSRYLELIIFDDLLYFTADDSNDRRRLWKSDGTTLGTVKFSSNKESGFYLPENLIIFNNELFFSAADFSGNNGFGLWKTDGTIEGTMVIKHLSDNNSSHLENLIITNDKLFFTNSSGSQLWVTDGTEEGTKRVEKINFKNTIWDSNDYSVFNNKLFIRAFDEENGRELWVTDGTEEGSKLIMDINPTGSSFPDDFFEFNEKLFFTADDGIHGVELWVTDGTMQGTKLLKDIASGDNSSNPHNFYIYKDKLYFNAFNHEIGHFELWVTDGTNQGTNLFLGESENIYNPSLLLEMNDFLYILTYRDKEDFQMGNYILRTRSDGSNIINLTSKFKSENETLYWTNEFKEYNGALYFKGNLDDSGYELWRIVDSTATNIHIDHITKNEVFIYPSPGFNNIMIKVQKPSKFYLSNELGQRIFNFEVLNNKNIDISTLNHGIYFIVNEITNKTYKFIKK